MSIFNLDICKYNLSVEKSRRKLLIKSPQESKEVLTSLDKLKAFSPINSNMTSSRVVLNKLSVLRTNHSIQTSTHHFIFMTHRIVSILNDSYCTLSSLDPSWHSNTEECSYSENNSNNKCSSYSKYYIW